MRRTLLVAALGGGGAVSRPAPASRVVASVTRDAAVTPDAPAAAPVHWANIVATETCFFFSGPFDGRDEHLAGAATLERDGAQVRLRLGATVFLGTLDGEALAVTRTSEHDHEGTWHVTETVEGTYAAGLLRARYRYEECGPPPEACPGHCTQSADLSAQVDAP
jgi:hypothetical protein